MVYKIGFDQTIKNDEADTELEFVLESQNNAKRVGDTTKMGSETEISVGLKVESY